MKHYFFLLPLFVLLSFSCTKQKKNESTEPQLPPLTQTGAGTFGCKVNGKIISIYSGGTMFGGPNARFSISTIPSLSILADKNDSPRYSFYFITDFASASGTYNMANEYPGYGTFDDFSSGSTIPGGSGHFYTDSIHTGQINVIYYDTKILSGTFEAEMRNDEGEVIHITEGRFDLGTK